MKTELKPGPELDALVAEKVMGWSQVDGAWQGSGYFVSNDMGLPARGADGDADRWRPSEDIGQVWEVVEKLQRGGLSVFLSAVGDGNNQACRIVNIPAAPVPVTGLIDEPSYVGPKYFISNEQARTMPHAICLAVLKAVEGP